MTLDEIRAHLQALQARDLPSHGGRTLAYVYDSGLAEADAIGREALTMFADSNGLDPTAFPSLLAMENDLVAMAEDSKLILSRELRHSILKLAGSKDRSEVTPPPQAA